MDREIQQAPFDLTFRNLNLILEETIIISMSRAQRPHGEGTQEGRGGREQETEGGGQEARGGMQEVRGGGQEVKEESRKREEGEVGPQEEASSLQALGIHLLIVENTIDSGAESFLQMALQLVLPETLCLSLGDFKDTQCIIVLRIFKMQYTSKPMSFKYPSSSPTGERFVWIKVTLFPAHVVP